MPSCSMTDLPRMTAIRQERDRVARGEHVVRIPLRADRLQPREHGAARTRRAAARGSASARKFGYASPADHGASARRNAPVHARGAIVVGGFEPGADRLPHPRRAAAAERRRVLGHARERAAQRLEQDHAAHRRRLARRERRPAAATTSPSEPGQEPGLQVARVSASCTAAARTCPGTRCTAAGRPRRTPARASRSGRSTASPSSASPVHRTAIATIGAPCSRSGRTARRRADEREPAAEVVGRARHQRGVRRRRSAARSTGQPSMPPVHERARPAASANSSSTTTPKPGAAAAERPEQVGVLVGARGHDVAVRGHDARGAQRVGRQPELALQPARARAEREAGDADRRHPRAGDREPVRLRGGVELPPRRAALHARAAARGVDVDRAHAASGRSPARRRRRRSRPARGRRRAPSRAARARARGAARRRRRARPRSGRSAPGRGRRRRCATRVPRRRRHRRA